MGVLVFNLIPLNQSVWTVEVWLASENHSGMPTYFQNRITAENFNSFYPDADLGLKQIIQKTEALTLKNIEKVFNRNNKKSVQLNALFENPQQKKIIQEYIDKRLHELITLICTHQFYLLFQHPKKDFIKQSDILKPSGSLSPNIKISKTQTGIKYSLKLISEDEKLVSPSESSMFIITNQPSLIVINNQLFSLHYINGNKIRPFLQKESLFIKNEFSQQFFNTFLADLTSKVQIQAEGFTVDTYNVLDQCHLRLYENVLNGKWMGELSFTYQNMEFYHGSTIKMNSRVMYNDGQWTVYQVKRDLSAEEKIVSLLLSFGLEKDYNHKFFYKNEKLGLLERLNEVYSEVSSKVNISETTINGKELTFKKIHLDTQFTSKGDWFDLNGKLVIGEYSFLISKLFDHIKRNNPYFELPDGKIVLLPNYLFARFEDLTKHAEPDQMYRLAKHHSALMEKENFGQIAKVHRNKEKNSFHYPKGLKTELRPYQIEGVQWLLHHRDAGLGALLADDMGLGKTIQTITVLLYSKEKMKNSSTELEISGRQLDIFNPTLQYDRKPLKALIALPTSLINNWRSEILNFAPSLQSVVYLGDKRYLLRKTLMTFDVIFTTYQTLVKDIDWLKERKFHYLILDESHYIKNRKSQIFKSISMINTEHKLSLSGTPIENSLDDLWSQMQFINPSILGSYPFFKQHYKTPIESQKSEKALETLKKIVDPFILRRTKKQVAKDLPELTQLVHYCEMSQDQSQAYNEELSKIRNHLLGLEKNEQYKMHVFSALMKLRQMANHPKLAMDAYMGDSGKMEAIMDVALPILAGKNKILLFSSFESHLTLINEAFQSHGFRPRVISGSTTQSDRQHFIDEFKTAQNEAILLITLKTGGVGLNLQEADYIFILDPWWNPFAESQAISRAHRIGRKSQVIAYKFITSDTIEEKIIALQKEKQKISDDLLEMSSFDHLTVTELEQLLE